MAFFIPKFTIYIQSRTKRLMEIKNPDHQNKDSRKYKKLQIWKLIDIKNIYHTMDEILEIGIKAGKNENRNINEGKTHDLEYQKINTGDQKSMRGQEMDKIYWIKLYRNRETTRTVKTIYTVFIILYFLLLP